MNQRSFLEFPEPFVEDLSRILRSESISLVHPGKTSPFLDESWTFVVGRWQAGSRAVVELDVSSASGDTLCIEVRAESFQRELGRQAATDSSETPYDELIADISSLVQELLFTTKAQRGRLVLPPYFTP